MPVPKNQPTTLSPDGSTPESSSPVLPEQEEFRQHLRHLAVSAVQVLLEQVMREELEQCIGASWGECTPNRRGYRNGTYTRDLVTPTGRIEDLQVPRDREGEFHSQVFERYNRNAPEVAEALTQMFVSGVSTHKVGKVAEKLMGAAPSASAVSRLNQTLTEQYEAWRERGLQSHYRVVYLDGIHFTVRHGDKTDATIILTALGVDLEGSRGHHTECCVIIDSKQTLSALQRWIPVFLLCSFTQHSVWHPPNWPPSKANTGSAIPKRCAVYVRMKSIC